MFYSRGNNVNDRLKLFRKCSKSAVVGGILTEYNATIVRRRRRGDWRGDVIAGVFYPIALANIPRSADRRYLTPLHVCFAFDPSHI